MFTAALQSLDHSRAYRRGPTVRLAFATPCPPGIAQPGLRQALIPRSMSVWPGVQAFTVTTRCRHLLHLAVVWYSLVITACRGRFRCTSYHTDSARCPPRGPTDGHPGDQGVGFHPLEGELGRCRRQALEGAREARASVANDHIGAHLLCQLLGLSHHLRRGRKVRVLRPDGEKAGWEVPTSAQNLSITLYFLRWVSKLRLRWRTDIQMREVCSQHACTSRA